MDIDDASPPAKKKTLGITAADLRGAGRLATQATIGLTDLVENLHHNILRVPMPLGATSLDSTRGITGLVYRSIRGVTRLVGGSVDALLGAVVVLTGPGSPVSSNEREAVVAALNGVLGDHLAATHNPLATSMSFRRDGQALTLTREALALALPQARGRVVILVHGLCMNDRQWHRDGHDHGAMLEAIDNISDISETSDAGFSVVYLRYNSGLPIATNGAQFADLIASLMQAWPVPVQALSIIGHSMGGLVGRSACAHAASADSSWLQQLKHLVCIGSPHHGAPLERGGRWVDVILGASPYTAAFARLGQLRSAGITDLRHGLPAAMPLPAGVACYAMAATLSKPSVASISALRGDGLVPVASALGLRAVADADRQLAFPADHQWVGHEMHHLDLLSSTEVGEQLLVWLNKPSCQVAIDDTGSRQ